MNKIFEDSVAIYDSLIDWPKRLANEEPLFRRLFAEVGAKRVLDAACGVGRHAALFHQWGLTVEGADVSPEMIARARAQHGEPRGLSWVVRPFEQTTPDAGFDAVVCIGNSLALVPDLAAAEAAVGRLYAALRPGGVLVLQVLNVWALPDGPCVWQKCRSAIIDGRRLTILKGVHRCGDRAFVDLLVVDAAEEKLVTRESVPFLGLHAEEVQRMVRAAGASRVELCGGYRGEAYLESQSADLIIQAHAGSASST